MCVLEPKIKFIHGHFKCYVTSQSVFLFYRDSDINVNEKFSRLRWERPNGTIRQTYDRYVVTEDMKKIKVFYDDICIISIPKNYIPPFYQRITALDLAIIATLGCIILNIL